MKKIRLNGLNQWKLLSCPSRIETKMREVRVHLLKNSFIYTNSLFHNFTYAWFLVSWCLLENQWLLAAFCNSSVWVLQLSWLNAKAESQHHKVTVGKKSNVQSMLGNQWTYRTWRLFVKNSRQLCYSGETEDSYTTSQKMINRKGEPMVCNYLNRILLKKKNQLLFVMCNIWIMNCSIPFFY